MDPTAVVHVLVEKITENKTIYRLETMENSRVKIKAQPPRRPFFEVPKIRAPIEHPQIA